jgi:hypothetical protein
MVQSAGYNQGSHGFNSMKTSRTIKQKTRSKGEADSDLKFIIVIGTAFLLALLIIGAIAVTSFQ